MTDTPVTAPSTTPLTTPSTAPSTDAPTAAPSTGPASAPSTGPSPAPSPSPIPSPDLEVRALHAGYPGRPVVQDVGLTVPAGQVVAIVGPNGCGKSTLLRTLARLHRPASGTVRVGGADIWRLRQRQAAHLIALLPQSPRAPEAVTVAGLVRYGRHPHQGLLRQWSREDEAAVREALAATGMLGLATERLDRLSGGQRQRCWLAMVLAQHTPVVLLDEPTSALDLGHVVEVLELVRHVAASGRTVVMVQHDLAAAARYADTIVAMKDGRVIAQGPPRETVDAPLVKELYGLNADILQAPGDGAPVVVPHTAVTMPH
ncbi:putative iron-siderophore ABC transporter ATP-binding protein [Streptomyces sp. NBRC 110611]|uniref:ABC transporter ATP-binding protein n=1 Tax=Streptomyces sp. NBRC 110611 TaxID=1621259 RepID=UPI0008556C36|nr:ABC transporter ATP-binding protein [Streptomyces sp. NBRC 110611]GAU66013.1 putative iron-siderophore ABC transporter ATP-binding protein [Streptomyces sp. NBRC 110611]